MTTTQKIMADRYDAGLGVFSPLPVLWANERAVDQIGVEAAKAELATINRKREKLGLPVAVHSFGSRLF